MTLVQQGKCIVHNSCDVDSLKFVLWTFVSIPIQGSLSCGLWYQYVFTEVYCSTAVTFAYPGQKPLFKNVDFGIDMESRGETFSLLATGMGFVNLSHFSLSVLICV